MKYLANYVASKINFELKKVPKRYYVNKRRALKVGGAEIQIKLSNESYDTLFERHFTRQKELIQVDEAT